MKSGTSSFLNWSTPFTRLLWGVLVPYIGSAQINESDTARFKLQLGLSGLYQAGNVKIVSMRSNLEAGAALGNSWYFKSQNNYLFQSFSGFKADEDIYSQNFLYFKPHKRWYPYAMGLVATNYRRELNVRALGGFGISYSIWQSKKIQVKASLNALYEVNYFSVEQFNLDPYNENPNPKVWRATTYLDVRMVLEKLGVHLNMWFMPAISNQPWNRAQIDSRLTYAIQPALKLLAAMRYTAEDLVPLGIKKEDFILTYGLQYNW